MATGANTVLLWATGGNRRAAGEIDALEEAGFDVIEIEPDRLLTSPALTQDKICAVVTNLLHGRDYEGGLKLVKDLRKMKPGIPVIVLTSHAATVRRKTHLTEIGAEEIATNAGELLIAARKLSAFSRI